MKKATEPGGHRWPDGRRRARSGRLATLAAGSGFGIGRRHLGGRQLLGFLQGDGATLGLVHLFLDLAGLVKAMPVPAGIRRPTMTFSFRPRSSSRLPMMAASVSTRVVSWKEAAEMKESVDSEALVMPSSMKS